MSEKLKLYVNSTCPLCNMLKSILEHNNIDFETIDIENISEEELYKTFNRFNELGELNNLVFPSIQYGDEVIIGYNIAKLEKLLNRKLDDITCNCDNNELVKENNGITNNKKNIEKTENNKIDKKYNQNLNKKLEEYKKNIKQFSEYTGHYLNPDENYVNSVLKSQLENKKNNIVCCPCKLGDIPCPCPSMDEEIKTYGHCFCGLYVSKEYNDKWNISNTPIMLSNRNIKKYEDVPANVNNHFIKVFLYFHKNITENNGEKRKYLDIEKLLKTPYKLKNKGYGYAENNKLVKFKEDEVHLDLQYWFNNFNDYYNNKDILSEMFKNSDYNFDIIINSPIQVPFAKEVVYKNLKIYSNYGCTQYRKRYLIKYDKNKNINNKEIIELIDHIITMEVLENINKLMITTYNGYSHKIDKLQSEIHNLIKDINVNKTHTFEEYLYETTMAIKEISELQQSLTKKYNLFNYYLTKKLDNKEFKEIIALFNCNYTIKEVLTDYTHLLNELSLIKNTVNEILEILETHVIISQNNKTIKLQDEIHKTSKTQLNMHKAIEGLYMIFAAFYFTELALIAFKGLKHGGLIHYDEYVLATLFIPVAILLGILISKKLKSHSEK